MTNYKSKQEVTLKNNRKTIMALGRIAKPVEFLQNNDGSKIALVQVKHDSEIIEASAYIRTGQDPLKDFYASLVKGQLVAIEYENNNNQNNIWNVFDRSYADKS